MFKIKTVLFITALFIIMIPSIITMFPNNNNLNLKNSITSIEVYDMDSDYLITTIEDEKYIKKLITKLDRARTGSIAATEIAAPYDFKLLFKTNNKTQFEIVYYQASINLNDIDGRYLSLDNKLIYEVDYALPIK